MNDNAIILPQPGALLVAHPLMGDPNFARTVVLLIAHDDDEGSMGVVINRADIEPMHDHDSPVQRWIHSSAPPYATFVGGPVEPFGYMCLHADDSTTSGVRSLDIVSDVPTGHGTHRVFRGYSGWAPQQLHDEINEGGWFVVPSRAGDVFDNDPSSLWVRVLRRQMGDLRRVANFPPDPTLN